MALTAIHSLTLFRRCSHTRCTVVSSETNCSSLSEEIATWNILKEHLQGGINVIRVLFSRSGMQTKAFYWRRNQKQYTNIVQIRMWLSGYWRRVTRRSLAFIFRAVCSSERLVVTNLTTRRHNPEINVTFYRLENLKYHRCDQPSNYFEFQTKSRSAYLFSLLIHFPNTTNLRYS